MKYIYKDNSFSIHSTDKSGRDITLWKTKTKAEISHNTDEEEPSLLVMEADDCYTPLLVSKKWFIICEPQDSIINLQITPAIFFDENEHYTFIKDDHIHIETNLKNLKKYAYELPILNEIANENETSVVRFNSNNIAIGYKKDTFFPDTSNQSQISEYYDTDLNTIDQIIYDKRNGRIRCKHFNRDKWNEHFHIEYLDKEDTQIKYQKPLAKLIYETPTWARGTFIVLIAALSMFSLKKCSSNNEENQLPETTQIISNTPQPQQNKQNTR